MNGKKEITKTSTNGRWGLSIIVPEDIDITRPQEGNMIYFGEIAGVHTYEFLPEPGSYAYYMLVGDVECISGCRKLEEMDLQSNNCAAILVCDEVFVYKEYGYKRRSSDIKAFSKGKQLKMSPPMLAAMGLLPGVEGEKVEIAPPKMDSAMAEAMKKAGLLTTEHHCREYECMDGYGKNCRCGDDGVVVIRS